MTSASMDVSTWGWREENGEARYTEEGNISNV